MSDPNLMALALTVPKKHGLNMLHTKTLQKVAKSVNRKKLVKTQN